MEKILGKYLALLFLFSMLFGIFGSCDDTPPKTGTLMDYIPQNTDVVFKISNFENLQADIASSSLLSKFEKTSPYSFFSEKASLFKNLHPESPSLLCVNKVNDSVSAYTFISKESKNLFQVDSIKDKTIETFKFDEHSFQKITIENEITYAANIDSVFVASSSQQIIIDVLNRKTERSATFSKVFNLPSLGEFTALVRGNKIALNDSSKIAFTSWSSLDISISPDSFLATGITLATDSIPQLLNTFEDQVPQQNDVAALAPANALGAISFTFNDAERFQKNLRKYRDEKENLDFSGIFGSVNEVGSIQLKEESAIFIKSIDALLTNDALARYLTTISSFREIKISTFSEPQLFRKTFAPFISSNKANLVFQLDNFFVFVEKESTAQELITAFQNNNTLKNTSYFKNTASDLSSASSLLIFKMQGGFSETISNLLHLANEKEFKKISLGEFPLAAFQVNYDRNFGHVTLSIKEAGANMKNISGEVSEKFNLKLENTILGDPQIIETNNGNTNVVAQDIGNKLYFISESGKILWTKKLDSGILGKVKEVDISGKKHIVFTTKDAFYMIDRNGKDANSFPVKFNDAVTQPLSVFDYDNNGNYRFVVVQSKDVLMYDKNAKAVKGFDFNKAKSTVVQPPIHIRMGNKDYILIAEESGKLNILSRVGKSRVSVSKTFNFSDIPIAEEDNDFVVITKENTKERISQVGKVSSLKLDVGGNYWFAMLGNTKATMNDNLLRIDGKLIELPLGVYTNPHLFNLNRNVYLTVTETQEKKVYVFNKNGALLNGFPVYGTSAASLEDGNFSSLVVKGESNSVLMYSF